MGPTVGRCKNGWTVRARDSEHGSSHVFAVRDLVSRSQWRPRCFFLLCVHLAAFSVGRPLRRSSERAPVNMDWGGPSERRPLFPDDMHCGSVLLTPQSRICRASQFQAQHNRLVGVHSGLTHCAQLPPEIYRTWFGMRGGAKHSNHSRADYQSTNTPKAISARHPNANSILTRVALYLCPPG